MLLQKALLGRMCQSVGSDLWQLRRDHDSFQAVANGTSLAVLTVESVVNNRHFHRKELST
jgi:hypothetical protein